MGIATRSPRTHANAPGGVVVDLGAPPGKPDEYFQRVRAILALDAMGHVPLVGTFGLPQEEGKVAFAHEGPVVGHLAKEGHSFLEGWILR